MIRPQSPPATRRAARALACAVALALLPATARAHFLWIIAEAPPQPGRPTTVRVFLNEEPEPGGPEFLKYVKGVVPTASGVPLAATTGAESVDAPWVGPVAGTVDAERDLGLKTKGDVTYRLYYTARLQGEPVAPTVAERGDKLRVRVVAPAAKEGKPIVQVLYDGKPAPKARIKTYPRGAEGAELTADEQGHVAVDGVAEGKAGLWATWTDPTPGTLDGKPYGETRYYATLTCPPRPEAGTEAPPRTTFATMPDPAVNSFGAAVLGDWLYAYSGHTGRTHQYSVATTSKHFRRLSLADRTTWEELPMGRDVQGVALVADGRYLYRVGGMTARNAVGRPHDLISATDFARFDPATKVWTDLAPLPVARSTHDAAIIGRKVYVVGGWSMRGAEQAATFLDDAAVFDFDRPEQGWTEFDQPFARRALAAAAAGGKLYVLGGLDDAGKVTRRLDIYDPAAGTWSVGPAIPGNSDRDGFAASAFALDGQLYMSGLPGLIARLDIAKGSWEAVGAWSLPRNTHRLLAGPGHALLAVGGNCRGVQTPVIEAVTIEPVASTDADPRAASRR